MRRSHRWRSHGQLIQTLLLTVAVAASPLANAAAPVLTQEHLREWWDGNQNIEIAWTLSASTTVTKHQYRYTVWNRNQIPATWTQDWTDLPLTLQATELLRSGWRATLLEQNRATEL